MNKNRINPSKFDGRRRGELISFPLSPEPERDVVRIAIKRLRAIEVIGRARELALDTIIAFDNADEETVRICSKVIASSAAVR